MSAETSKNRRIVTLYEERDGRQVPVYRYWPIPQGVLAASSARRRRSSSG